MDIQILSNLITNAGFSIAVAIYLLLEQKKKDKESQDRIEQKDKENREYFNSQMSDLKTRLEEAEEESAKDKAMFLEALNSFNKALEKFDGIEDMKKDICTVVEKVGNVECQIGKVEDKVDKMDVLLSLNIKI